jgi:hypothetical protein
LRHFMRNLQVALQVALFVKPRLGLLKRALQLRVCEKAKNHGNHHEAEELRRVGFLPRPGKG